MADGSHGEPNDETCSDCERCSERREHGMGVMTLELRQRCAPTVFNRGIHRHVSAARFLALEQREGSKIDSNARHEASLLP